MAAAISWGAETHDVLTGWVPRSKYPQKKSRKQMIMKKTLQKKCSMGSETWVPPIVVTFPIRPFSTFMILEERGVKGNRLEHVSQI